MKIGVPWRKKKRGWKVNGGMMWFKEWLTKFCILTRVIIISTPTY